MAIVAWMVTAAVAAVLASWFFNTLVHLVWRPYVITRNLRAQGVHGPGYRFFSGNLGEIKRLRAHAAAGAALDVGDHNFVPMDPMVQPHHHKWIELYGRTFMYWIGATPSLFVADVNVVRQVLSDRTRALPQEHREPAHLSTSWQLARGSSSPTVMTISATVRSSTRPSPWTSSRYVISPFFFLSKS